VIRVNDLYCGYGESDVLRGVSVSIEAGEMVALCGPNGSGKTTLIRVLSGVLPLRAGNVEIAGRDASGLRPKERARLAATIPQRMEPPPGLRVFSMVLMGRYPYATLLSGYSKTDREAALAAMRETSTLQFADRRTHELSGGEFQRVLMARAVAQATGILLLDEAGSGLDVARKVEIHDMLAAKNAQGLTVLSAIHDLNLAALYCSRLLFLKDGRLVLDGPPKHVFTEKNLSEIYDTDIKVAPHPATGAPQAHLVPGAAASR
jgi:iron complex transport system ATP-binding protein